MPINLDPRAGKAWSLYVDSKGRVSLFPSVWRTSGCGSHFILWDNTFYVLDNSYDPLADRSVSRGEQKLTASVFARLSKEELKDYVSIAVDLRAVPWDVLLICRTLVRQGIALEGSEALVGHFGLR